MTSEASPPTSTTSTMRAALQRIKRTPLSRAEQAKSAYFRGLARHQQLAIIAHFVRKAEWHRVQGKNNSSTIRLLGVVLVGYANKTQSERTSPNASKDGRATKVSKERAKKGKGQHARSAKPDGGHNSGPISRALAQLKERLEAQKNKKKKAKSNKPWRNVPQFHAALKEELQHRPAKASNDRVRAYRRRLIQQTQSAPPTPLSKSTTTVRFKEGQISNVQTSTWGSR